MTTASARFDSGPEFVSSRGGRVMVVVKAVLVALDRWQSRRQALRQLYLIDRRTLKDIGLDRSEIQSLVLTGGEGRRGRYARR